MVFQDEDKQFIHDAVNGAISTATRRLEESLTNKLNTLSLELSAAKADNASLRRQLTESDQSLKSENASLRQQMSVIRTQHDDLEQYGRRMSVRIEGIEVKENETNDDLRAMVTEEMSKLGVSLRDEDIVRLHRSSRPSMKDGVTTAQTIVKVASWRAREKLHGLNKKAKNLKRRVRVNNDLTRRRYQLLSRARDKIYHGMTSRFSVEEMKTLSDDKNVFAYVNINSDLKVRVRGRVLAFNTDDELDHILQETFG